MFRTTNASAKCRGVKNFPLTEHNTIIYNVIPWALQKAPYDICQLLWSDSDCC